MVPPLWKKHSLHLPHVVWPLHRSVHLHCPVAQLSSHSLLPPPHHAAPVVLGRVLCQSHPPTPFVCPTPSPLPLQRQSFWDAFFIIMSRREGDWLGLLLRLLLQARCAAQLLSADHTAVLGSRLVALGSMQEHAPAA